MPLPPTRFIDAGPGVPLANPQVAMATGEAMARFGETIAQVGERGFQVMEKVRKVEEAGKLSAFFANADEQANQFSTELMSRSDTGAWPAEWKAARGNLRQQLKGLGLSPEAQAQAEIEFNDWGTRSTIRIETLAANKSLEMGRAQLANSMKYYASRDDSEAVRREASRGLASGTLNPVEHEQVLRDCDRIDAEKTLDELIQTDPHGTKTSLESGDFLANHPGATKEMVDRGLVDVDRAIKTQQVQAHADLQDAIASGDLRDEKDLDQRAVGLRPVHVEILRNELRDRANKEMMAARATPEYQHKVIGQVSDALSNLKPGDVDQQIQIDALIRQLPDGEVKSFLNKQAKNKLEGKSDETPLEINLQIADEAFKTGWFGKSIVSMPTQKAINDGFLTSNEKLKALGFDDKQINMIVYGKEPSFYQKNIEQQSKSKQKDTFQSLWEQRANKATAHADAFTYATADAIVNGKNEVKLEDSAKAWKEKQEYGRVKSEIIKWNKAHPKATSEELRNQMLEIAAPGKRDSYLESAFPMPDVYAPVSSNNPLVPAAPGGVAGFSTDSILPPKQ